MLVAPMDDARKTERAAANARAPFPDIVERPTFVEAINDARMNAYGGCSSGPTEKARKPHTSSKK